MRYALSDYLEIYVTKWDELVEEFLRHLSMTSLAVLLALVIGVPLGIFITRHKKLDVKFIKARNLAQYVDYLCSRLDAFLVSDNIKDDKYSSKAKVA